MRRGDILFKSCVRCEVGDIYKEDYYGTDAWVCLQCGFVDEILSTTDETEDFMAGLHTVRKQIAANKDRMAKTRPTFTHTKAVNE